MAQRITIEECFPDAEGGSVNATATVEADGIELELDNHVSCFLSWDKMANVEELVDRYPTMRVIVFKQLVEMLGKIYAAREVYKALVV